MLKYVYLLKILYHLFFCLILYYLALFCEKNSKSYNIIVGPHATFYFNTNGRIRIWVVIVFCTLEGVYSIICGPRGIYISDRYYYAKSFALDRIQKDNSVGLYVLHGILRPFTDNPEIMFFFIGAIYLLVTVVSYNLLEQRTSSVWLFIGMSQYLLYGCYQLKQALAAAFVSLSIFLFFRRKKYLSIAFLIVAIAFHEVAWIMVPIYLVLFSERSRRMRIIGYVLLFLSIVSFRYSSSLVIQLATRLIPGMGYQLRYYVDGSNSLFVDNHLLTVFKGIPLYLITFEGFRLRRELKETILHYDSYLYLSCFASVMSILSAFMYWMWRFGELVYLPVFVFAALIFKNKQDRDSASLFYVILGFLALITFRKLFMSYFIYGGLV